MGIVFIVIENTPYFDTLLPLIRVQNIKPSLSGFYSGIQRFLAFGGTKRL